MSDGLAHNTEDYSQEDRDKANQEIRDKVEHLKVLADNGVKYIATACDRIGEVNRELMAISMAGWRLHSIVPFILPSHITTDHMTYFCVVAEKGS